MMKSSMTCLGSNNLRLAILRGRVTSLAATPRIIDIATRHTSYPTTCIRHFHSPYHVPDTGNNKRFFTTTISTKQTIPGKDPLSLLQQDAITRKLCNDDGYRLPDVHWVFSIAINGHTNDDAQQQEPPNLRTVGFQRVTSNGIDFVMKRGGPLVEQLLLGENQKPLSMLYMQGKYKPGEIVTQWRGEGKCESLPLEDEIITKIPIYTMTGMVATKRTEKEHLDDGSTIADHETDSYRIMMERKTHFTQVTQQTRMEIENNTISFDELNESIQVLRFRPTRMELMEGGPSEILWNRWEWLLHSQDGNDWKDPKQLLPH